MRCSFCRRPDSHVAKLVAGPFRLLGGRVYICDRCAAETARIMDAHGDSPSDQAVFGSVSRMRRLINTAKRAVERWMARRSRRRVERLLQRETVS